MLEKLKTKNKNHLKKNALYLFLLITNIILFIGLANYFMKVGININLKHFDDISAIIATIIILGFISLKLPKIKELGDHSIFGMAYLLIICALGLMTSYFNGKFGTPSVFEPYLEMFKILCGVLIFLILATNFKPFKEILDGKFTQKNLIICLIIFTAIGLFASYAHVNTNGAPANIRCLIVMISGLFGGPFVGIPVAIISGVYRYSIGGTTALPSTIATILSGVIGSLIFIWNNKKFPKTLEAMVLMFLFTGFEMTPSDISFPFVRNIYPKMAFASVIGILLFSIVIMELRENMHPELDEDEKRIMELENELEDHDAQIEQLKDEIEKLKNEKSS